MQVPFNPIRDIPLTFRDRVCTCPSPVVDHEHEHRFLTWCKTCYKPMRWQLRICSSCNQLYIADFRDTRNCKYVHHQRCWDCLQIPDTSKCDGRLCIPEALSYPPVGLNPRESTMSDEESKEILRRLGIVFDD